MGPHPRHRSPDGPTSLGALMAATSSPARPSTASSTATTASSSDDHILRPMIPAATLEPPSRRHRRPARVLRLFRSLCGTLPILTPKVPAPCKLPSSAASALPAPDGRRTTLSGSRVSGTLFGPRRGRVSLCVQQAPRCLPTVIIELALQTHVLMREMSTGMVRIALETEKGGRGAAPARLMEEPLWSMFYNGKKSGYGVRREATEDDLVMIDGASEGDVHGGRGAPREVGGRGAGGGGRVHEGALRARRWAEGLRDAVYAWAGS